MNTESLVPVLACTRQRRARDGRIAFESIDVRAACAAARHPLACETTNRISREILALGAARADGSRGVRYYFTRGQLAALQIRVID